MFISGYQTAQITGVVRECFRFFLVLFLKKIYWEGIWFKEDEEDEDEDEEREREKERKQ